MHSNVPIILGNQVYLDRPRMCNLLIQAVQHPLVTVVAGAGYGKTLAVDSCLLQHTPTIWVQLSELDNNPFRFWETFTQAIGVLSSDSAEKFTELGFPQTERQFERFFTISRQEIFPSLKYIIVYDDFHLLTNPAVLHFIERSISSPFPNLTSIIISRIDPPFNMLGRLSKGLCVQITENELRFTREEMLEYFELQHIHPLPEDKKEIYHLTEGWAFGIYLAGRIVQHGGVGQHGRSIFLSNIYNLIESEILSGVSKKLRLLFIKLSLIDHLSLELVRDIAGDLKLVKEIEQSGTFIRFDTYLNVYRIHTLLLEYLKKEQDRVSEEEKRVIYNKAGRWCAAHNHKMDAFSYYEKAGNYAEILDLIFTLPMLVPETIAQFLLEIIDRAPAEIYTTYTTAYVAHTMLLFTLGRFEEAENRLQAILEEFEALPPSMFNAAVLFCCYNNLGFCRLLTSVVTGCYDFSSYFEKAVYHYHMSNHQVSGSISVIPMTSYICQVGNTRPGEMEKFIDAVDITAPILAQNLNGFGYGVEDLARAELAFFRADMEKAERFSYQAVHKARSKNQYEVESRGLFFLLRISLFLGTHEKIPDLFKQLEAQLEAPEYLNRFINYDIIHGWFYAHIGMTKKLASWLKNDFEELDLNSWSHGQEHLVKAKYQFTEKRYPAALAALENIRVTRFGSENFLLGKIERMVLEAMCYYQSNDKAGAFQSLKAAYDLAESNSLDMPFIEMGKDMRALAGAALKETGCPIPRAWLEKIQRNAAAYGKKFFSAVESFRGPEALEERGETLSPRELEVLSGLARGLTREEIAADGAISINTVKSALRSIYYKLGAINGADAIRIATSRGLLKDLGISKNSGNRV